MTGLGGVKPRGTPEYEEKKIQKLLEENETYQHYLRRSSQLNPTWTAELQHPYPTEESRSGSFHSYVLVTVESSGVRFQTKDKSGKVRDQGDF